MPTTMASLPLSERLSPNTTSELYGLAIAAGLANATTIKANADAVLVKNACFMINSSQQDALRPVP